jgi:hypothetical protein
MLCEVRQECANRSHQLTVRFWLFSWFQVFEVRTLILRDTNELKYENGLFSFKLHTKSGHDMACTDAIMRREVWEKHVFGTGKTRANTQMSALEFFEGEVTAGLKTLESKHLIETEHIKLVEEFISERCALHVDTLTCLEQKLIVNIAVTLVLTFFPVGNWVTS